MIPSPQDWENNLTMAIMEWINENSVNSEIIRFSTLSHYGGRFHFLSIRYTRTFWLGETRGPVLFKRTKQILYILEIYTAPSGVINEASHTICKLSYLSGTKCNIPQHNLTPCVFEDRVLTFKRSKPLYHQIVTLPSGFRVRFRSYLQTQWTDRRYVHYLLACRSNQCLY